MSGLHRNIQRIVEFQPYRNLIEVVHQASKAERQLQQDAKSNRGGLFSVRASPSGSKFTPRSNANRSSNSNSSGGLRTTAMSNSSSKELATQSEKSKPATSSTTSMASTARSSEIQCFKCGGRGNVIRECPNNHTILVNDNGEYESASEEEQEAFDEEKFQDANENKDLPSCEFERGAGFVVTQILSVQMKEDENGQWHDLF
jgi:hypothetical protein